MGRCEGRRGTGLETEEREGVNLERGRECRNREKGKRKEREGKGKKIQKGNLMTLSPQIILYLFNHINFAGGVDVDGVEWPELPRWGEKKISGKKARFLDVLQHCISCCRQ